MKQLKGHEIRQMWLDFWRTKGHDIIDSAPLIPQNDPTLLWINAGVAPLKKYFDGSEIPNNKRMANAQKSIRTNDIENVGRTARHHTFFEMLGNFSIGDYFREEALTFAMEVLTSPKWFAFDLNKLYFTVYPNDEDTIAKWISLGVDPKHIIKVEDNFWEIGEGPCGPDTEIFFDRGQQYDPNHYGIRLIEEDMKNDRYIEIWNIVFSQFNAKAGQKRSQYKELPSKNIDTGMGLERMACVIQGTNTNYETDLFYPIINQCVEMTHISYTGQMAYKVIADHVRSVVFALSDGATFSNEGRGYVLRRLLRRAVRFGKVLGMKEAFLYQLVAVVIDIMKGFYPYLLQKEQLVTQQIKIEEEKFLMTLESGEKRLLEFMKNSEQKAINKETAFLLYDTFGFPFELTQELAEEQHFAVDEAGFHDLLNQQKERARNARNNHQSMNTQNEAMMKFKLKSTFVGYETLLTQSKVIALFKDGSPVKEANGEVLTVFSETSFYAESGGQVGDVGECSLNNRNYAITNTIKLPNGQHASFVDMRDDAIKVGDHVTLSVDEEVRLATARNHSATHLLNEALRNVVGSHVIQQGSYVAPQVFRFDFNNFTPLTSDEILKVETLVNQEIRKNHPVTIRELPIEEAKKLNAQAVFGEKYGSIVRVVDMEYSREFCGGTHVKMTGDIQKMAIISIETKGSGIFRIEGATGDAIGGELKRSLENVQKDIDALYQKLEEMIQTAKAEQIELKASIPTPTSAVDSYAMVLAKREELETLRTLAREIEKELNRKKMERETLNLEDYIGIVREVRGCKVLVTKVVGASINTAKDLVDRLSDYLKHSVVLVGLDQGDKLLFICKSQCPTIHAGNLVKMVSLVAGGNGGGRNDFAQAGAKDVTKCDEALQKGLEMIEGGI